VGEGSPGSDESLSEIALNCGFADQSHFSREFRRQFGRTPRDYREHYR
jgi:AraC-like DNA-binding protein